MTAIPIAKPESIGVYDMVCIWVPGFGMLVVEVP